MIAFECPHCGNKLRVKTELAGKQGKCSCGRAVTVPAPTALPARASAQRGSRREARAAAAIEPDHIVGIYQVGEGRGVPFLAMQLLQGESLDDRLQREGKLPIAEVLRVGREIAEGLAAAHEK